MESEMIDADGFHKHIYYNLYAENATNTTSNTFSIQLEETWPKIRYCKMVFLYVPFTLRAHIYYLLEPQKKRVGT